MYLFLLCTVVALPCLESLKKYLHAHHTKRGRGEYNYKKKCKNSHTYTAKKKSTM